LSLTVIWSEGELYIERLLTDTQVSLAGLSRVWIEPLSSQGSLRIFGNGGLFSFLGVDGICYTGKAVNFSTRWVGW
jgi:hypothetical protein